MIKISEDLKNFLKRSDVKDAIQNNDFDRVYYLIYDNIKHECMSEFTQILFDLNENPLNYMTEIPKYFLWNSNIKNIYIPDNIKAVEFHAFENCRNLKTISFQSSVLEIIMPCAFEDCINLETITLPASLKVINWSAFGNCKSLKTVYYEGTKEDWKNIDILELDNDYFLSAEVIFKK